MAEIETRGSVTHPLGWTFLGAGGVLWFLPLLNWLPGTFADEISGLRTEAVIMVVLFLFTLLGLCLELALAPYERVLFKFSKLMKHNPPAEAWSAAWRVRWKSTIVDSEFRRYEAMASFGRAYSVHAVLTAIVWLTVAHNRASILTAVAAGVIFAAFFIWVWYRHTKLIFDVVLRAQSWEPQL